MKLKMPDKSQWAFIIIVMVLAAYYTGSVIVYFFNDYSVKFIFKKYDSGVLWNIITNAQAGSDLWLSGVLAFLAGILISLIIPVLVIYSMSKEKQSLFGDAKFASDKDIEKSPQVVLYHPDEEKKKESENESFLDKIDVVKMIQKKEFNKKAMKRGALIGKYKGKYPLVSG